jgi:hypothetical protein
MLLIFMVGSSSKRSLNIKIKGVLGSSQDDHTNKRIGEAAALGEVDALTAIVTPGPASANLTTGRCWPAPCC